MSSPEEALESAPSRSCRRGQGITGDRLLHTSHLVENAPPEIAADGIAGDTNGIAKTETYEIEDINKSMVSRCQTRTLPGVLAAIDENPTTIINQATRPGKCGIQPSVGFGAGQLMRRIGEPPNE